VYSLSQLKRGIDTPALFFREANRLYHRRLSTWDYNENGTDVLSEDWDVLIILDACRCDVFDQQSDLAGDLSTRISRGSNTVEFLRGNFGDKSIGDTVYVTANPQLYRHSDTINAAFYEVENIWNSEGWNTEYGTVLPETVTKTAKKTLKKYTDKRIIVHFVQPHYPFIESDTHFDKGHLESEEEELNPWDKLMQNKLNISHSRIWDLYEQNLRRCLPHVKELIDSTPYKTAVTADHGNMFGERATPFPIREWGHPRGIYTKELVKVPWLIAPYSDRKEIVCGEIELLIKSLRSD
jgi:hypothetical protein